jgi:CRISPR-associated endonuclease/helicase Cas3
MIPFNECFAREQERLATHLEETGLLIKDNCLAGFCYAEYVFLAGLFHDAGKATIYFQDYLQTKKRQGNLSNHALLSALLYAYTILGYYPDKHQNYGALLGFLAIARHHGNFKQDIFSLLEGYREELENKNRTTFLQQLRGMDLEGFSRFINSLTRKYSLFLKPLRPESPEKIKEFLLEDFWSRSPFGKNSLKKLLRDRPCFFSDLYYSCGLLWQADKIHSATQRSRIDLQGLPGDLVSGYLQDLEKKSSLDQIRSEIRSTVIRNIQKNPDEQLFTLTAPTGSGKTLTLLDAALKQMSGNRAKRIIYCLPFTSVIEQNHAVFNDVLAKHYTDREIGQDLLLKHHHLTSPIYQEGESQEDELTPGGQELMVETWQSEIIVTTFHQLLYTVFTARNRNIKRFPQLSEAVIILDEVQAIPVKYWEVTGSILSEIASSLQSSIILATATKPLIFPPEKKALELLPEHEYYYGQLSRVRFVNRACAEAKPIETPFSSFLQEVVTNYEKDKNLLLVLDTKKAVKKAYKHLLESGIAPGENILLLSKALTPEDRLKRIRAIDKRMEDGEKLIVVSTQLIEAGVDLSFDLVHRDFAPLDCLVQTAGRCNRHADESGEGSVFLWYLYDDSKYRPFYFSSIYDSVLLEVTREALADFPAQIPESCWHELTMRYFRLARARAKGTESEMIREKIRKTEFNELEDLFKLIEDRTPTSTYFVIKNNEDQELWDKYLDLKNIEDPMQRRSEFKQFKPLFMQKTVDVYCRAKSEENVILPVYARMNQYSEEYGLDEESISKEGGTFCL